MSFWDTISQWGQQVGNTLGNTFNPTYAKQFYAQQANLAFQSGNWGAASLWDAAGGFVAMGTGSPQSPGQALWSVALSTPILGAEGALNSITTGFQFGSSFTSALSNSWTAVTSGTPMSLPDWAGSMIGLGGSWAGARADAFAGLGNSLAQVGNLVGGEGQLFFAAAAQRASNIGQVFGAAANGAGLGGFLDSAWQAYSALSHEVGGVLFEHCDAVLTGIGEIVGGYWDETAECVVLIGRPDGTGRRPQMALPTLDADHLKVALRATIAGQPIGVSIDPPAKYRYGQNGAEMPPDGSQLLVSYLGGTSGTLFGAIMFESDRIMKCLSIGMDNRARKPFTAHVAGFRDLFRACQANSAAPAQSWHRFWFKVDKVRLLKSPVSKGVIVGYVRMKVLTELELAASPKGQKIDPHDREFAAHLTRYYDAYAREFPVLARLKELAKISAIARFLVAQRAPLDLAALFHEAPAYVATPETTPSILRSESTVDGSVVHSRRMSGGVDLDVVPVMRIDSRSIVRRIQEVATAARKQSETIWSLQTTKPLYAKAISLKTSVTSRHVVTDHQFASANGLPRLNFKRIYDATQQHEGDFGPGWNVYVPYSLLVVGRTGKKAEVLSSEERDAARQPPGLLVLRSTATGRVQMFRRIEDTQNVNVVTYAFVTSQTFRRERVEFQCDRNDTIRLNSSTFHMTRENTLFLFQPDGRLKEVRSKNRCLARLSYENNRLSSITNEAGHHYDLVRGPDQRVVKVHTSDSKELEFTYHSNGTLRSAEKDSLSGEHYEYNLGGRLCEVRNPATGTCNSILAATPRNTPATVSLALGQTLREDWKAGHLTSVLDEAGGRAEFEYGATGLRRVTVLAPGRGKSFFEFDDRGHLATVRDATGSTLHVPRWHTQLAPGAAREPSAIRLTSDVQERIARTPVEQHDVAKPMEAKRPDERKNPVAIAADPMNHRAVVVHFR